MNQTENYQLNQWEMTDRIRMEDFNADNAKIDAALKDQVDSLAALAATVPLRGNCQIYYTTYVGRGIGNANAARVVTCPYRPLAVFISSTSANCFALYGTERVLANKSYNFATCFLWRDNSAIWYGDGPATGLDNLNETYRVVALMSTEITDPAE